MAKKPASRRQAPTARPQRKWSVGVYLQWLPVISVGIALIASYVHQGDRLDALEKSQPTASIAEELTHSRDRQDTEERDINKLDAREAADVVELKQSDQQLWSYVGRQKGVIAP